jgi:hypothetical protein
LLDDEGFTAREFYHDTKLVNELPDGGQLLVTSKGKPKVIVARQQSSISIQHRK